MRDPLIGTVLGRRFRVEERLAAGGFGVIYRAMHQKSQYEVALKVLHQNMLRDEKVVARFRREAQTLTTLRNRHTVTTYELVEEPDGRLFMVMELLRGETLYQVYKREGALPWRRVVEIGLAVCESLAEAHAIGVVHRDLKPENIVIEPRDGEDIVKVLDFGIAKVLSGSEVEHAEELTNHNEVIGTWDYVSPEQIRSEGYSGRSDIYTLAVVMYEMIVGARPFSQTGAALMAAILTASPPAPSTRLPGIPRELDRALLRCLETDPQQRFADVGELAAAFEAILARVDPTGQVALPDEDRTRLLVARPDPPRVPYATPMGLPIVLPQAAELVGLPPPRSSAPSWPALPPDPVESAQRLSQPPFGEPAQRPSRPPQRPSAPPPLVSGWATSTVQPLPQPAFAKALERDRLVARILWGTVLAIAFGIVLAFVL